MDLLKVLGVGSQSFDPQQVGSVSGVSTDGHISHLIFFFPLFSVSFVRLCSVVVALCSIVTMHGAH